MALRWSAGLGVHRAPIDISLLWSGRKALNRRGEVASPIGLGDPTPTHSPSHPLVFSLFLFAFLAFALNYFFIRVDLRGLVDDLLFSRFKHHISEQLILQQPALNRTVIQCKPFRSPQPD